MKIEEWWGNCWVGEGLGCEEEGGWGAVAVFSLPLNKHNL